MKRSSFLVTWFFAFCIASPQARAQGKVRFANDSRHLVYFTTETRFLLSADAGSAGQAVPAGGLTPSGITLEADLWAGTAPGSLTLIGRTGFGAWPGLLSGNVLDSFWDGGTTLFFQVQVYDRAAGSYAAAVANWGHYYGASPVFTAVTSTTIVPTSLVNPNAPSYSTWAPGDWNLDASFYGVGARGAISIQAAPEPSLTALLGLGLVAVAVKRYRVEAVKRRLHHG